MSFSNDKGPIYVIGLTGPNASGKGEVSKYLKKKGFKIFSLSDILRFLAKKNNLPPTRENLINFANNLRKKYGSGILAKLVIKNFIKKCKNKKVVVESIRNPSEIKILKSYFKNKFFLIYITAPQKLRFKFIKLRSREGDPKTYKEFLSIEKKEKSNKSFKQQIHKCKKFKDFFVNNNSSLEILYKKIDNILAKIYATKKNNMG